MARHVFTEYIRVKFFCEYVLSPTLRGKKKKKKKPLVNPVCYWFLLVFKSLVQALRVLHSTLRHAKWQEPNLNIFYFGRVWWSWKKWFWTVSTLEGCSGLEITDFEQFLLWEGGVVMKELILNSFYFGRVGWSWKNWFWTFSTLGGYGASVKLTCHYRKLGCLNIWGCWGHQGASECMGASKHIGGVQMSQSYGGVNSMPPSVKLTCH